VVTELKNRSVQNFLIACVDGVKGFPEAIESVYPQTAVQLCLVHMLRHSLNYVSWKMRRAVAGDQRSIYAATILVAARVALDAFEQQWGSDYPLIVQSLRRN
jgi:putative transposase